VLIQRPDGTNVQPVDADVNIASLSGGAIYSITNPVSGAWSVIVNGFGNFNVRVAGESKLSVTSFNFVEERGRPGHKGDFPVIGSPIANQLSQVDALLSAEEVNTAQFELRTPEGAVLQSLTLSEVPTLSGVFKEFHGDVTVPNTSYLTYVKGLDVNGKDYQRVIPGITKPQTVKITAPAIPDLHPGETTTYKLQVKNFGAVDSFQLSGHDDLFIRSISPATFTLNTNQSIDVTVELEPPPDTPHGYADTLTFLAQSTGNSGAQNYANVQMLVTIGRTIALGEVTPRVVAGDNDLLIESGEVAALSIQLLNEKGFNVSEVVGTLTTETEGVTITSGISAYFDLPLADMTSLPTGNGVNRTPYTFIISDPSLQLIEFALSVTYAGTTNPEVFYFALSTTLPGPPVVIGYTGPPVAIPDGNVDSDGPPINIPITVSGLTGFIADINFSIDGSLCTAADGATTVGIDHTYVVDLVVKLTSPAGTTVTLIDGAGGGFNDGNNFCQTVLDDEGGLTLIDLILPVGPSPLGPPYTGTFIPEYPLAAFKGEDANGTWTLTVIDRFAEGTGNVRAFSLVITTYQ
jgi:subtilisin-like proprotein convertase family protein